jgi:quercetin dioxygenase-like cupin family protein
MATTETAHPETFPIARADLGEEVRGLRRSPRPGGRAAKTLLHAAELRMVLMVLDRGVTVPAHHANGSLTVQVIDGRVVVNLLGASFDLAAGQLLAIEHGVTHALAAIEDSAILLTIGWNPAR